MGTSIQNVVHLIKLSLIRYLLTARLFRSVLYRLPVSTYRTLHPYKDWCLLRSALRFGPEYRARPKGLDTLMQLLSHHE